MFLDNLAKFSDNATITADANSSNYDCVSDRNIGVGKELAVAIFLLEAPDAANGDETYSAVLQTDSDENFGSPVVLHTFNIPRDAKKGSRFVFTLPKDLNTERYLRLAYSVGGTTPSMKVSAYITTNDSIGQTFNYPSGYRITG